MKPVRLLLIAAVALPSLAWAVPTQVTSTSTSPAQTGQTLTEETERSNAQIWGLSLQEYRQYENLMRGIRGSLSDPKISPIEVLGIHAKTDADRRKYAEMFARLMAADAYRVIRFQEEYQAAFRRLYPNLPVLQAYGTKDKPDRRKILAEAPALPTTGLRAFAGPGRPMPIKTIMSQPAVVAGDRLLLFTKAGCPACDALARRVLAFAKGGTIVDVYVVGAQVAADVQRYARSIGVDPAAVQAGQITLNLPGTTFERVLPYAQSLPQVVRKRNGQLQQLRPSDV